MQFKRYQDYRHRLFFPPDKKIDGSTEVCFVMINKYTRMKLHDLENKISDLKYILF